MNIKQALELNFFDQKLLGKLMFPNNKHPGVYLYKKIRQKEGKRFSFKDHQKVISILKEIIAESEK